MRLARLAALCSALCALSAVTVAQAIPTRTLTKPEVEVRHGFSWIEEGARELRDGRVIVLGEADAPLQLVDLASGTVTRISRKGNGPGEYQFPVRLFALPGDSTAVLETNWRRMLVLLPSAKPGGFLNPRPDIPGGSRGPSENLHVQRVDGRGRYYGAGAMYEIVDGVLHQADSIAILRWTPGSSRLDTVGYVGQPPNNVKASSRGRNHMISVGGGGGPFGPRDAWTVASDGRVAVVSATTYGIAWTDPATGRRTTTPPIPYVKHAISDAHKKKWMDGQQRGGGGQACGDGGCSTVPRFRREVPEPKDWGGEFLPPFQSEALFFSPEGALWVKRTGPVGAPLTYDLIDQAGKLKEHVTFPPNTRLVGFGANGAVYASRTDGDDLQYLQRYRLR